LDGSFLFLISLPYILKITTDERDKIDKAFNLFIPFCIHQRKVEQNTLPQSSPSTRRKSFKTRRSQRALPKGRRDRCAAKRVFKLFLTNTLFIPFIIFTPALAGGARVCGSLPHFRKKVL